MTEQNEAYTRLKNILKELFQLDQADLDFGIYRIMNQKRDEVTDFLENRLIGQITEILEGSTRDEKNKIEEELQQTIKNVTDAGMNPDDSSKVQELRNK